MELHPYRWIAAGALLTVPYLSMGLWLALHFGPECAAGYAVSAAAVALLLAYVARTVRWFYLLHLPFFLVSLLVFAYAEVTGEMPGYPIALVLITSSWEEVRGFFGAWQEQKLLLAFLLLAVAYLGLGLSLPARPIFPVRSAAVRWAAIAVFAVLAGYSAREPDGLMKGIAAGPLVGTVLFLRGPLSSASFAIHGVMLAKRPYGATRNAAHEVHVLVIGESSRRDSWSLYGYSRQTTPHLASLDGEAIFFANALSDANATVFAVPLLLTGIDPEQFDVQAVHGNLIDLAKEAGYWSGWLSNQDAGISFLVGIDANEMSYTKVVSKPAYVVYPPDEVLLAEFERQLARHDGALFIGMHTYGSHAPYPNRFPEAFAHFSSTPGESPQARSSDQQVLDAYDDAIRYTDWFLGEIVNRLRKLSVPATLTYLSDHGEELSALDGRSGHGLGGYSPRAFEIPAFVWMNEAYRSAHPDKISALAANAGKVIRSHDFFYSEADLMGIEWPGAVPQRSFASPKFTPDTASRYFAAGKLVVRTD